MVQLIMDSIIKWLCQSPQKEINTTLHALNLSSGVANTCNLFVEVSMKGLLGVIALKKSRHHCLGVFGLYQFPFGKELFLRNSVRR